MEHIGQGQAAKSAPKSMEEVSAGQANRRIKAGAFRSFHGLFYLLEIVPSKFMRVETRLVTAAKYFLSFDLAL
jgi:hypothetical protein